MSNRPFLALRDFSCPELGSEYSAGMRYTVRPGNDVLAAMAAEWEAEGRIEFLERATDTAATAGTGTVD